VGEHTPLCKPGITSVRGLNPALKKSVDNQLDMCAKPRQLLKRLRDDPNLASSIKEMLPAEGESALET
jgi:hypothetical protein